MATRGPRPRIDAVTTFTASLERLRCVPTYQAPAFVQLGYEQARMRRSVGNADPSDIENGATGTTIGGVGEVRQPVGAHAPGELQIGVHHLLHQGQRAVAVLHALVFLLLGRSACREQVLAGYPGRLELEATDPEELRVGLWDLSAAGGVGEVR